MKRQFNDEGVSEVLGYVIILGIVMTALMLVMLIVFPSIQDTKNNGQLKTVEQGFTVVDSRLSKARFSTSIFQEAPFKLNDGVVTIDDDFANSNIKVDEYTETSPLVYQFSRQLYLGKLGTLKVTTDNGEVAYQAGGVWIKYLNGNTIMQSPPDFDYNGVTLTLPIMQISKNPGNSISGGDIVSSQGGTILIQSEPSVTGVVLKYPETPSNAVPNPALTNPIAQGKMIKVTIVSDYYMGWYYYFKELGLTPDVPNDAARSVTVPLSSGHGRQQEPIDNDFDTKYMKRGDTEPVTQFEFTICTQGNGNSYTAQYNTDKQQYPWMEIDIGGSTAQMNQEYAEVIFTYHYGSANHEQEEFRGWIPFQRKSQDQFTVDLLNDRSTPNGFDATTGLPLGTMVYTATDNSISWGPNTEQYDAGSEDVDVTNINTQYKSMYDIVQHYFWLMGSKYTPQVGPVYEHKTTYLVPPSQFILQFKSDEQIKYLYITEASIDTGISLKNS